MDDLQGIRFSDLDVRKFSGVRFTVVAAWRAMPLQRFVLKRVLTYF